VQLDLNLTDSQGQAVGDCSVVLRGPSGVVADMAWGGQGCFPSLQPGRYLVTVRGDGLSAQDVPLILSSSRQVTLYVPSVPAGSQKGALAGVVRSTDGKAAVGASLILTGSFGTLTGTTDIYGSFCFSEVDATPGSLQVNSSGASAKWDVCAGEGMVNVDSLLLIASNGGFVPGLADRSGHVPLIYHSKDRGTVIFDPGLSASGLVVDVMTPMGKGMAHLESASGQPAVLNVAQWGQGVCIARLRYRVGNLDFDTTSKFIVSR
jgi:hypothetical protein